MKYFRRLAFALLSLAMSLLATGGQPTFAGQSPQNASAANVDTSPLIDKVRAATARFQDIRVALGEGWVQGTPCVSGPDFGAMGVHFVQPARIAAALLDPKQPEALIYEPLEDGNFRLVGVEFIILANVWQTNNPTAGP